jgi:6-pyruvoyltetrahydropterin/6-carboxytetrahydropterin synthase
LGKTAMPKRTAVTARYHFEASHWLPGVPETHKCHRMHGHNYKIDITLDQEGIPAKYDDKPPRDALDRAHHHHGVKFATGFVIDFGELDKIVHKIIEPLDHRTLNDIPGLENPTAELIADWFIVQLAGNFLVVRKVVVWETDVYSAEVIVDD